MRCSERGPRALARLALALCLVAGAALAALPAGLRSVTAQAGDATWRLEVVDPLGYMPSLACDSNGIPAIAYQGSGGLQYARWNGVSWDIQLVDNGGGSGCLRFDRNDSPGIAYTVSTGLKYARHNGSGWDVQTVDGAAGRENGQEFLAFDPAGSPSIVYTDGAGALKYARLAGNSWEIRTIDSGRGGCLAFDLAGNPGISYGSGYALRYAHWSGSSWDVQTAWEDTTYGAMQVITTSLAFDPGGNPALFYIWAESAYNTGANYASWNGATWTTQRVGGAGNYLTDHCALGFNSSGIPFAAWGAGTRSGASMWCAERVATDWNVVGVWTSNRPGDVYGSPLLVFDSRGSPAIAFSHSGLTYAYLSSDQPPALPVNTAPGDNSTAESRTPTLQASAFSDPDTGDVHAASRWQITTSPGTYSNPVLDSGWDTSNLTSITVPSGSLTADASYAWRVMYQDNHGTRSDWSAETRFSTGTSEQEPETPDGQDRSGWAVWAWILLGLGVALTAGLAVMGARR